jgi:hypothetical protein
MKKLLLSSALLSLCFFSFKEDKKLKAEMSGSDWVVYLRNVDRLSVFAGRNVANSELLGATKDTVSFYTSFFYVQLGKQVSTIRSEAVDSANKATKDSSRKK